MAVSLTTNGVKVPLHRVGLERLTNEQFARLKLGQAKKRLIAEIPPELFKRLYIRAKVDGYNKSISSIVIEALENYLADTH